MAEPDWIAGRDVAELGAMLSAAQLHIADRQRQHGRICAERLADVIAGIALAYLNGQAHAPSFWRPQIVASLVATPYREGCCAWRG